MLSRYPGKTFTQLSFLTRSLVLLCLLSSMLGVTLMRPAQAQAYYSCAGTFNHCYGEVQWPGASFGTSTYIVIGRLLCYLCDHTTGYHLNEETWIFDDTNGSAGGYVETGYGIRDALDGAQAFFYSSTPPGYGTTTRHEWDIVYETDVNTSVGFKITRNRQTYPNVLVSYWTAVNPRTQTAVVTNNMGTSSWLGTRIDTGVELSQNHSVFDNYFASSQGAIGFSKNLWQSSDGTYWYQANDGADPQNNGTNVLQDYPNQASWNVRASAGNPQWPGGLMNTATLRESATIPATR